MAEITPESIEPGFERINNPEVQRTPPQEETEQLMEHLQGGVVIEQPKPIGKFLETKPNPEVLRVSDKTQKFIDRFDNASPAEAVKIINEAMAAVTSGEIPRDEAYQIIERGNEIHDQSQAA